MGLLDKLLGKKSSLEDEYLDGLVQLGALVVRRPPRGVRLRTLAAAQQIDRVVRRHQAELKEIETQMEAEEARIMAEAEAEAAEKPELEALVRQNRAGILNIDRKITTLSKQLKAKRANFKYFVRQLEAQEAKVKKLEDDGRFEEAEAERQQLKRVRLDHMRQQSALQDLEEEIEAYLDSEGSAGEGMRAKLRLEEIEENERNRDKVLNEVLGALDRQADTVEAKLKESQEAPEDALAALGEEVYAARIRDPAYEQVYEVLDPIAAELAGS
jgi:DNA repair exonuclease SbcCD ATPase subunit